MKTFVSFILLVFLSCQYICAQVAQPRVYEITADTALRQEIDSTYRLMLEDKNGKWTIDEVSSAPLINKFHYSNITQPDANALFNAYWFRYRLKNKMEKEWTFLLSGQNETVDFYLLHPDGNWQHLVSGIFSDWEKKDGYKAANFVKVTLKANEEIVVYQRIGNSSFSRRFEIGFNIAISNTNRMLKEEYEDTMDNKVFMFRLDDLLGTFFIGFLLFAAFFNSFFYAVSKQKMFLYFTLFVLFIAIHRFQPVLHSMMIWGYGSLRYCLPVTIYSWALSFLFLFLFFRQAFKVPVQYPRWDKVLVGLFAIYGLITLARILADGFWLTQYEMPLYRAFEWVEFVSMETLFITLIIYIPRKDPVTRQVLLGGMPIIFIWSVVTIFSSNSLLASMNILPEFKNWLDFNMGLMELVCIVWFILFFSWFLFMQYNMLKRESAQKSLDNERLAKEKEIERNELISKQNIDLEKQVEARTADLKKSLLELKSTQSQLIQSEKMASLGELTAGIAHEIQNPLNFVNNFSEVNGELIAELKEEIEIGNLDEAKALANDIADNEQKINHHGKRADAIVKGMLQHSRASSAIKESTDINKLADEYLRLAYHGLRAKDKSFNATFKTEYDESIGNISIVPQDIGRVILNLITNAFYAAPLPPKGGFTHPDYKHEPTVWVSTKKVGDKIVISVRDNGPGIPPEIVGKIFQPFFTTKPTGQGTGLGLSLAYDIVKAHGGDLKVETEEGNGTTFLIQLPAN